MDLEQLRNQLSAIDRQILELVAERQRLSGDIGALKRATGRPTRDFAREKQVLDKARALAAGLGVPPGLAEALLSLLIRSSLANQEQARVRAEGQGSGKPALVIGGSGKMGRWFTEFLHSQGFNVLVADPAGPVPGFRHVTDWRETPDEFAVTVVSTPIPLTGSVLQELGSQRRSGLIFDIGSLKSPFVGQLKELCRLGLHVTSVHPMFGPDTELLSGRHVVFLDAGCPEATTGAAQLFASTMAAQIRMDLEDHDRLIAYVLGLSHALNIAFFTALAESGETVPRLADISSTTFDAQLQIAGRVAEENPHLYFAIQAENPFGLAALEELQRAVARIATVVRTGDEAGFVQLMEQGRTYLASRR
ncbi:MAG: prephenate dehydrogenase/arogenate dehydrogenase family protein [Gammaproteobacteria bacterium]|nr:prephenate dehydrogenase/arogenate dehydrogenase family protein [Gammaproteobacteria bacterium]